MIAPGLSYIGMKGQNVIKDNDNAKNSTIIYPVGGRKGDDHISITLMVAERMTYVTDMITMDTWPKCDHRSLMAMMGTMMVILIVTLRYC